MKNRQYTGYFFRIRARNGVVVNKVRISAENEESALMRLRQLYPKCEVLAMEADHGARAVHASYESVLDAITEK